MHKVSARSYVGLPNETASLTTQINNGAQINVTLDGAPINGHTQFQLPSAPGSQSTLQISLFGPSGASCAVGLATVDGGTDGDFLLSQPHLPPPSHTYALSVAAAASLAAFAKVKAAKPVKQRSRKADKRAPRAARKGGRR